MKTMMTALVALALTAGTANAAGDGAVKIGVLGDQSGPFSDLGGAGAVLAAKMAVEDFGGSVLGKPIEVVSADMQNKPDIASTTARRWFDVEGVDVIADLPLTSVAMAVQAVAREKKKVLLITSAASADLTGSACSPYTVHWMDDTRALSVGTARAIVAAGGKKWFFLTPDYAFGKTMEEAAGRTVTEAGGQVLGSTKFALGTADYSSALVTAMAAEPDVVGLSSVGGDTITAAKQAAEFGLTQDGRKVAVFLMFLPEVHGLGLESAQGLYVTDGFYWDENPQTRKWSERFFEVQKAMPSKSQANTYAAVMHYLKAVEATGTDDTEAVIAKMKQTPADYFGKTATIRQNGRVMYDLTLYEVKAPEESKYPWDYYEAVRPIKAEEAFGAEDPGECRVVN